MIETAFAQVRFALSVGLGIPFSLRSLDRLIEGVAETRREFGTVGDGAAALNGPPPDWETQRDLQLRRFRSQAVRAARETAYYGPIFAAGGLDPARLTWDDIARLPRTTKEAIRDQPGDFVRRGAQPVFRTTTTGTTGRPTHLLFSAYEMGLYIALASLNHLMTGAITNADIVQISSSSRATLGNTCFAGACARVGALVYLGGLVDPAHSLALLAEEHQIPGKKRRASVLLTYASYLGELIETGLAAGYGPTDFGLERISIGGETVTSGLKRRAAALFGQVIWDEGFGQTETWPATGTLCPAGHLHFEATQALLEVVDPETGAPTPPGTLGTLVLTALPPFRETMPILRCDSGDLVQTLTTPPTCALAHLPAVSNLLGKARLSVRHTSGWTTPRAVFEALEALDVVPLPARCGFWAHEDGVAVEVVTRDTGAVTQAQVAAALEAAAIPLRALTLHRDRTTLTQPFPLRGDLRETMFSR